MSALAVDKEWRGHVEQTKKHEEAIQAALPVTTTQLSLIGTEVKGGARISSSRILKPRSPHSQSWFLVGMSMSNLVFTSTLGSHDKTNNAEISNAEGGGLPVWWSRRHL